MRTLLVAALPVAAHLSPKSTKLRWAFEWPTRTQWRSGQRYGLCWTPD